MGFYYRYITKLLIKPKCILRILLGKTVIYKLKSKHTLYINQDDVYIACCRFEM
jgi:hypothetical protein